MRTNLADNPIATWKDLRDGLRYRIPYGVEKKYSEELETPWLLKGVTLRDLMYCELGYLPEYSSDFTALPDSQKRMYITKNTVLSLPTSLHTVTLNPLYEIQVLQDNSTTVTLRAEDGSSFTDSAEVLWYRFTALESMQDCTVTYENLKLYVSATGPLNMSLHGQVLIRQVNTQNVIASGMILPTNLDNAVNTTVNTEMPKSFNIQKGRQYEIVLSIYATQRLSVGDSGTSGNTGSNLGGTVGGVVINPDRPGITLKLLSLTFTTATATLTFESNNKCVPYKDFKANTKATVPVFVQVKNSYGTYTTADYVQFIYRYKLVNGSWTYKTVGEADWDKISANTTVNTIVNVLINPVVGDIESDYLEIYFGKAGSNKDMAYTVYSGDTKILSNSGRWASITLRWNENAYAGAYSDMLKQITAVYFSVD